MVGPKYERPPAPVPPAYKESPPADWKETQGWKPAQPNEGAKRGKWWEIYNDPELECPGRTGEYLQSEYQNGGSAIPRG